MPERCDVSSLSVSAAVYLGPVASRGWQKSRLMSFTGMAFTSCTNLCLKYPVWAVSRHPCCHFPYWRCHLFIRSFLAFGWKTAGFTERPGEFPVCFPLDKPTSCYWGTFRLPFAKWKWSGNAMFICSELFLALSVNSKCLNNEEKLLIRVLI